MTRSKSLRKRIISLTILMVLCFSLVVPITSSASGISMPPITSFSISQGNYRDKIVLDWTGRYNRVIRSYIIQKREVGSKNWSSVEVTPASGTKRNTYTDKIKSVKKCFEYRILTKGVVSKKTYTSNTSASKINKGWTKVTICIDPGHYRNWNTNSAMSGKNGLYKFCEAEGVLAIGKKLSSTLNSYNIKTVMTRTGDECKITNNDKGALINRGLAAKNCDFFISLHTNATSSGTWNESSNAVLVLINKTGKANKNSISLAKSIGTAVSNTMISSGLNTKAFNTKNSVYQYTDWQNNIGSLNCICSRIGSDGTDWYAVLRGASQVGVPGILIEQSYHVNPTVRNFYTNKNGIEKVAKAEANAIAKYYGFI